MVRQVMLTAQSVVRLRTINVERGIRACSSQAMG